MLQDLLANLKCFSLICYNSTRGYDNLILPLLRRMSYVEELSLYIHILGGSTFISGIHHNNKILSHMPRLHTFSFYFASENAVADSAIHYDSCRKLICRVFSLPFRFDRLTNITNNIPNIVFNSVPHLKLRDKYPFKHEFFIRLARGFPFLKSLYINTILAPNWKADEYHLKHIDWCSIVEYPHLISLDIDSANIYYAEHFLNETKTHLPCLTELKIRYEDLEMVTKNFTRNETRRNCTKVDPSKQQDEHWLFGEIGNYKQVFFPAVYAERITPTLSNNIVDTTSQLSSRSWVMTLAECQGKTVDKHLSFQKGEFILVREQKDATWYSGQLNDKIGWFPRNYVRPATEIEIENNKNLTKKASISEKSLNLPTSNDQSLNDVDTGDVYEAIYSYEATDPSDLSFDIGERVIVLKCDGDWWTGQIGDRTGLFLNNYVQKVNNIQKTVIAITPFQATEENHLSFEQSQIIYITKKDDKGWYQGEIRLSDQSVRVELPQYIAIFPYEAQQDDELSFPADAILEILHEANTSGWFKARFGDQVGLIPSTYVQPIDTHSQSSSIPCELSSKIIPCTPTTADSVQHPFCDDSTITLIADSSTLITDISSHETLNNSSRISAIRELIETEQRYVNDLRIVANEFIKPLSNGRILNDYEIEQLFSNWFSLIACNTVFLSTLQEQVQYKEHIVTSNTDISIRTPRSVSMSNITTIAQVPINCVDDKRPQSLIPQICDSPPVRQLKYHSGTEHIYRSPSANNLTVICPISIERSDDNIVPQSTHLSSIMTINESTQIGEILCSYLPYMADTYFQYCNSRSQADKYLQSKADLNEQFRSYLNIFQNKTGGLSLNGFLTKPIQRVTRYPLLIEKILKHTILNHPDYRYIQQAYECARQLNERINKQICEQENSLRLDWLQQHVILNTDENSTDRYVFDELIKFNSITRFHKQRQLLLHGFLMK
ncbi:unnamed protein product, partial [Rotaria sp. Silwood1]